MKPWTGWMARLGLAGTCLVWTGCGGSNVPDPDSDSNAAKEAASGAGGSGPPPIAAAEPAAPAAAQSPAGVAAASPLVETASAETVPGAAGDKPTEKSATAEMLALANAPAPGAAPPEGAEGAEKKGEAAAVPGGGPPGYPGAPGIPGGGAVPGATPGYPGAPGVASAGGAPPGYPTSAGGPPGAPGAGLAGGAFPGSEGPGGGRSGFGGAPGGGGEGAVSDFTTPQSAVMSFLSALRAKDPERLADATALHAPSEASARYQKVFTAIIEQSLAPEDFDEIAKKFEGMSIVGQNQAKSSGRLGIIVGKTGEKGSRFTRTITVRREKSGWKVADVSGEREFEKPIMIRGGGTRGRRTR